MTSWGEIRTGGRLRALGRGELWLGPDGCVDAGVDGGARAAVAHGGAGTAWHNLAALHPLADAVAREVVWVGQDHGHRVLGRFRADGSVPAATCRTDLLAAVWGRLLAALGPLPWPEVLLLRSDGRWPVAFAVPGAVVVRPVLDLGSPRAVLLYLVHELVHQWIGGMVRSPGAAGHATVEALVEAVTWYLVEQEVPRSGPAFARLHRGRPDITWLRARLSGGLDVLALRAPDPSGHRAVVPVRAWGAR